MVKSDFTDYQIKTLLICNTQKTCDRYRTTLNHTGITFIVNAGPDNAPELFRLHFDLNQPFDLVLLDFLFPQTDGLNLSRQFHAIDPLILCIVLPSSLLSNKELLQEFNKIADYTYFFDGSISELSHFISLVREIQKIRNIRLERSGNNNGTAGFNHMR